MAAELDRSVGQLEVLNRSAEVVRAARPNIPRAASLAMTIARSVVEHDLGGARRCRTRPRAGCRPRSAQRAVAGSAASTRTRSRSVGLITFRNTRRLSSTGVNRSVCVISISDLPSSRYAVVVEREVEASQDLRLRLGGEVHQRVAAHQQIDARDRRVLDEVVAAEDHAPTQVLAKHVALIGALEEALERVRRHVLDLARAGRRRAVPGRARPRRCRWRRS